MKRIADSGYVVAKNLLDFFCRFFRKSNQHSWAGIVLAQGKCEVIACPEICGKMQFPCLDGLNLDNAQKNEKKLQKNLAEIQH